MALIEVLPTLPAAAQGTPGIDVSPFIAAIWAQGHTPYLTVRQNPSGPIAYEVQDLSPPPGSRLVCESPRVRLRGLTAGTPMIRVPVLRDFEIDGGSWNANAPVVSAKSTLRCRFRNFGVGGVSATVFALGDVEAVEFRDAAFSGSSSNPQGLCIEVGRCSRLEVFDSKFMHVGQALGIDGGETPGGVERIDLINVWFERIRGTVVSIRGSGRAIRLLECYFEHCGTTGKPEIELAATSRLGLQLLRLASCHMTNPGWRFKTSTADVWDLPPCRVRHSDHVSLRAWDNLVRLVGPEGKVMPFLSATGSMTGCSIEVRRNRLRAIGVQDDRHAAHDLPNDPALVVEPHPMSQVTSPDTTCPHP